MVKFQFFCLQGGTEIIKFYISKKLTRSESFCLYLIYRRIEGGGGRGKADAAILEPKWLLINQY